MANSFFQFKQFMIEQRNCGMKVTTEGCLFGALNLAPASFQPQNILDIGTGTGLLALMKAQQTEAKIDGIEIDEIAFQQAKTNFENSPWLNRLSAINVDLLEFKPNGLYDLIICNPPFFQDNQLGSNHQKNRAIHNSNLSFEDLATGISRLLNPETGIASVLYPDYEMGLFSQKMEERGFYTVADVQIHNRVGKPIFRRVKSFSRRQPEVKTTKTLIIKESNGAYTEEFIRLLKDYYLHL
ncbi:tRNA1(Val) (adenine(37)-N6)-methyltransferase [Roseivirga sp.]|uniref:tRNA1(Val) (adenine(37)-N6)-methyltransferase n=1 Tax=Roseivirga sp. TaxID=1964215 RepID=UPI002B26D26F|nr:methyltransferase [Roseivirga sp.]